MTLRLGVVGEGRMGRAVAELARTQQWTVRVLPSAAVRASGLSREVLAGTDVLIDFTSASGAPRIIRDCAAAGCAVVSGTTGWDGERPAVEADVRRLGGALLWAPNFAIGVHLFASLVREAARLATVAGNFDLQIVETHHAQKRDAPSGTAKLLAQRAAEALGREPPIASIRTGHVPGTHLVILDAPFEQIRLEHEARDRRVFAAGAIAAARWLQGRHGVFTLDDMLRPEDPR